MQQYFTEIPLLELLFLVDIRKIFAKLLIQHPLGIKPDHLLGEFVIAELLKISAKDKGPVMQLDRTVNSPSTSGVTAPGSDIQGL